MLRNELIRLSEQEIIKLGVPVSSKGFYYLVYAVVFAVEIGLRKINLNKEIYDRIAYLNDVTKESVENVSGTVSSRPGRVRNADT